MPLLEKLRRLLDQQTYDILREYFFEGHLTIQDEVIIKLVEFEKLGHFSKALSRLESYGSDDFNLRRLYDLMNEERKEKGEMNNLHKIANIQIDSMDWGKLTIQEYLRQLLIFLWSEKK